MKLRLLPTFLFLLIFQSEFAQQDSLRYRFWEFHSHYGMILPHSESIRPVSHTNPWGLGLSLGKLHTSATDQQVFGTCWNEGFEAGYWNFQNPDVIGWAISLGYFAEPWIVMHRRFIVSVKAGAGLSFHNKVYDSITNPSDLFFSSRISFPLSLSLKFKFRLGEKTFLTLSGNFNHISNGGFKLPNKGMNFPTISLGMEYFQKSLTIPERQDKPKSVPREPSFTLTVQHLFTVRVIEAQMGFPQKTCYVWGGPSQVFKKTDTWICIKYRS